MHESCNKILMRGCGKLPNTTAGRHWGRIAGKRSASYHIHSESKQVIRSINQPAQADNRSVCPDAQDFPSLSTKFSTAAGPGGHHSAPGEGNQFLTSLQQTYRCKKVGPEQDQKYLYPAWLLRVIPDFCGEVTAMTRMGRAYSDGLRRRILQADERGEGSCLGYRRRYLSLPVWTISSVRP